MHHLVSIATSVATGIKGVCVTIIWSVGLTSKTVSLPDLQAVFIKIQFKCHYRVGENHSLFYWLSFCQNDGVLCCAEASHFMRSQFLLILVHVLTMCCSERFPVPVSSRLCPIFSSIRFYVDPFGVDFCVV